MPKQKQLTTEQLDDIKFDFDRKLPIARLTKKYGVGPDRLNRIRRELGIAPRKQKTNKIVNQPIESGYFDIKALEPMI